MVKLRSSSKKSAKKDTKKCRKAAKKKVKENMDVSGYLKKIQNVEAGVERTKEESKALLANDISFCHFRKGEAIVKRFIEGLAIVGKCNNRHIVILVDCCIDMHIFSFIVDADGNQKWKAMLVLVANPHYIPGRRCLPRLL